jgi:hypothetical protein
VRPRFLPIDLHCVQVLSWCWLAHVQERLLFRFSFPPYVGWLPFTQNTSWQPTSRGIYRLTVGSGWSKPRLFGWVWLRHYHFQLWCHFRFQCFRFAFVRGHLWAISGFSMVTTARQGLYIQCANLGTTITRYTLWRTGDGIVFAYVLVSLLFLQELLLNVSSYIRISYYCLV